MLFQKLTKKDIAKEWLSFMFSISATAIGFFLAVWINSYLDRQRDYDTFLTERKMIIFEAQMNKKLVDSSYMYYGVKHRGIILAEMNTSLSEQIIKNKDFIYHISNDEIRVYQNYIHYVRLINSYKNELNRRRSEYNIAWEKVLEDAIEQKRNLLMKYIDIIISSS